MTSQSAKWIATGCSLLVLVILALYLATGDLSKGSRFLPRCGFHELTGLYCPGCGNTRASYALLHGDVGSAIGQNAFFVLSLPFLILGAGKTWYAWMSNQKIRLLPFRWKWSYSLVIIGVLVAFTILRNVPARPFSWLAPDRVTSNLPVSGHSEPKEDSSLLSEH